MRIAIVGSRDVKGFTLERMLPHIPPEATELVSGGAYGIDQMAEQARSEERRVGKECRL